MFQAMDFASKKLVGEHDFRNFCKMDAANVHNFRRHITLCEIRPFGERFVEQTFLPTCLSSVSLACL